MKSLNPAIKSIFIFLYFIIHLSIYIAYASTVEDLYKSVIPINNNQAANSKEVLKQGMLQVLTKVSGSSNIEQNPIIKAALDNPEEYLFKYTQNRENKQRISVQEYINIKINHLLKQADIEAWGKQRPTVLSWVTIELDPRTRIILNESNQYIDTSLIEQNSAYKQIIQKQAMLRGVPIAFPLQDLTEQMNISQASIWAQFIDDLKLASERYQAPVIFSASINKINYLESLSLDSQLWQAKFMIINKLNNSDNNQNIIKYEAQDENLEQVIEHGINWLADNLAKGYTIAHDLPMKDLDLRITGINTVKDYVKLNNYLNNLSVVSRVAVNSQDKNILNITVSVKQGESALKQALSLDNKLVLAKQLENDQVLQLRWRS